MGLGNIILESLGWEDPRQKRQYEYQSRLQKERMEFAAKLQEQQRKQAYEAMQKALGQRGGKANFSMQPLAEIDPVSMAPGSAVLSGAVPNVDITKGTGILGMLDKPGLQNAAEAYGRMASIPGMAEYAVKGLGGLLEKAYQKKYNNVYVDDNGKVFGVNEATGTYEPIEQSGTPTKYKTVQGTDRYGNPTTELVNPSVIQSGGNGRITIGGGVKPVSEGDAKQIAQQEGSLGMLQRLEQLVSGNDAVDISPENSIWLKGKQLPYVGGLLSAVDKPITKREAEVLSLTKSLSTSLLAAMRGAQVGPAEQERFEQQLPVVGQRKDIFMENMKLTRKNLQELSSRIKQLRFIPEGVARDSYLETLKPSMGGNLPQGGIPPIPRGK